MHGSGRRRIRVQSAVEFFGWIYQRCETGNIDLRFLGKKREDTRETFLPLALIYENPHKLSPLLDQYKNLNSYFGVALRNGNNGKKESIAQIPALHLDLDGAPLNKILESPWKPSAIVETSPGKFHIYWKLREPADKNDIEKVENLLKRLTAFFAGDRGTWDGSRILRIPGTLNYKTTPPFTVTVKSVEEIEYNLSDFDDLPEVEQDPKGGASVFSPGDRLKKIMEGCRFLQHCDKDRAILPEPEWYAMVTVLKGESGGRELIHSLSRGYPKYSRKETDEKILHALGAGPATCQRIKSLFKCGQNCGVVSPVRLAQKKTETVPEVSASFPRETIGGLAGQFANLYSTYLESPWSFFAFGFLTCLGNLISDRVTLASEIAPQPRLFTVNLGESADDRKSESIKKTVRFFEDTLARGSFRVCHGIGSAEGLARVLSENPENAKKLILVYDELKAFVSKATIEGATLLPAVNSFFEGNRFQSATKTHSIDLDNVYLSVLAASTLDTFSRMWTPAFLDIGFLNRLWLVRDRGERKFSIPREIPLSEVKILQKKLGSLLGNLPTESVRLQISEEARAVFDEWYFSLNPGPFSKRLDAYGLRLMIILAINEREMSITEDVARAVVTLLRWQLETRRECDPVDAENNIAKMEEMIRRALARSPLDLRELQRKVNYHRYGIFAWRSAIDNLCKSREVYFDHKSKIYSLIG